MTGQLQAGVALSFDSANRDNQVNLSVCGDWQPFGVH
jgi:hypothetical protein